MQSSSNIIKVAPTILSIRKTRRAAYNAQIELSNMISSLSTEPEQKFKNSFTMHFATGL